MNTHKILLAITLLISAQGFAMDPQPTAPATATVKAGLLARAKDAGLTCWAMAGNGIRSAWTKVQPITTSLKARCTTCGNWAATKSSSTYKWVADHAPASVKNALTQCGAWVSTKGTAASKWLGEHTPASVKTAISNPRTLKIVGVAAAVATAATCWHFFGHKLTQKKAQKN